MRTLILVVLVALAAPHRAHAYPQYQLARDGTCTGCHLSPDGGGTLNENGLTVAESTAWKDGDAAFLHGVVKPPSWLSLGGDGRFALGFIHPGVASAEAFPMQAEVAADAHTHGFSFHVVGGLRSPQDGGSPAHVVWSREHYVMWRSNPDENHGFYIRAGRLLPTFGLRLAEHNVYTERLGGKALYAEAYGVATSYVGARFEVHATGFVHDPIATSAEHGDGGAIYAEVRIGDHAAIGADAKYSSATEQHETYAGMTGKLYVPGPDLLFQAEAEVIRQHIVAGAGDRVTQLAGYVLATHPLGYGLLLDIGAGHFTEDTRVAGLYRDALDANLHWFITPHVEGLLTTELELLDRGRGPTGGFVLAQIHYRL